MDKSILRVITIIFSFVIWQVSCFNNADRTNPLDPKSDNFEDLGSVSGQTLTFYNPFKALADVVLRMTPGTFITKTNANGVFLFNNVPVGNYRISTQKEGFASVADSVTIKAGQTTTVQLNLDALPIILSFSIISCHISRWWPQNDLFLFEIMTEVQDLDGVSDIEFVQFEIPELNFSDTLQVTQSPGLFTTRITESRLPGGNLQNVLGREIMVKAADRVGFENSSQPKFLARIIEQIPIFESPVGDTLEVSKPLLKWRSMNVPFNFNYKVEVFRVDQGILNVVDSLTNIDQSTISVRVTETLPPGTYFWTVSVVDEFGNWSRSKEASFFIK